MDLEHLIIAILNQNSVQLKHFRKSDIFWSFFIVSIVFGDRILPLLWKGERGEKVGEGEGGRVGGGVADPKCRSLAAAVGTN